MTTGLILQELLQGFAGPRARRDIIDRFAALPLLAPDRQDYIDAAEVRNRCRRAGVQIGTIDALLAQLCIRHRVDDAHDGQELRPRCLPVSPAALEIIARGYVNVSLRSGGSARGHSDAALDA